MSQSICHCPLTLSSSFLPFQCFSLHFLHGTNTTTPASLHLFSLKKKKDIANYRIIPIIDSLSFPSWQKNHGQKKHLVTFIDSLSFPSWQKIMDK
jgi:hypothetical protein